MHAKGVVGLMLKDFLSGLHEKPAASWRAGVSAALQGGRLSSSGMATGLGGSQGLRHRVKRIDRLIGNAAILRDRAGTDGERTARWPSDIGYVLIVADWSDRSRDHSWHLLRASVVVGGPERDAA